MPARNHVHCTKCGKKISVVYTKGYCSLCEAIRKLGPKGMSKKRKYGLSGHGSRTAMQRAFKTKGATHESEHTVGYAVLSHYKRGKSAIAKSLEMHAPAYQEKKGHHRNHIGTGTSGTRDGSGFNSSEYRNSQRAALEESSVSNAIQLNQLAYAFLEGFTGDTGSEIEKADGSYTFMLINTKRLTYAKNDGSTISLNIDAIDRCEAYLARVAARNGKWPNASQINDAKKRFGIPLTL